MEIPKLFLPLNYCVQCGDCAAPMIYQCARCYADDLSMPTEYQSDHPYFCVYCRARLDRYNDFNLDGSFKSDHFFCQGCDFVATTQATNRHNFDRRGYSEKTLNWLEKALKNKFLPLHIRQAYERQQAAFLDGRGIYIDDVPMIAPSD